MTITLEAIRAAGGIVRSDGNIFFRDISMLQGLAGAAPAAVAPQGDEDDSLLLCASDLQHSAIYDSHSEMQDCARAVADRIKALAAPALEAPAAPAGWKLVPANPTDAMLGAAQKAWLADPLRRSSTLYAAALAAAPQAPAIDLRPHLAWALKRISTSLGEGEHFAAAQQALDAAQHNTPE